MTTLNQLSRSQFCQMCGTLLPYNQVRSILDRTCIGCSQKQAASKSYVESVMPERQPTKIPSVQRPEEPESSWSQLIVNPSSNDSQSSSQGKGRGGVKDDGGKLMWHLMPWKAAEGLIKVLTFGAKKYAPNGWRLVPNAKERYLAALLRHTFAMQSGEKIDPESGLRHIDHLLCNAAFLAELED